MIVDRIVAGIVAGVWLIAVIRLRALMQWHHFWIGVVITAIGIASRQRWLAWIGILIMTDDAIQHIVQWWDPTFRSPLHLLYRAVYHRLPKSFQL